MPISVSYVSISEVHFFRIFRFLCNCVWRNEFMNVIIVTLSQWTACYRGTVQRKCRSSMRSVRNMEPDWAQWVRLRAQSPSLPFPCATKTWHWQLICLYVVLVFVWSGTDEEQIIAVLVRHSLSQRLDIKSKFKTMFGEVRILKHKLIFVSS